MEIAAAPGNSQTLLELIRDTGRRQTSASETVIEMEDLILEDARSSAARQFG